MAFGDSSSAVPVFCCWVPPRPDAQAAIWEGSRLRELPSGLFELLSFRDEVIPQLKKAIGASNYDDEIIRTLSLLIQYEQQKGLVSQA